MDFIDEKDDIRIFLQLVDDRADTFIGRYAVIFVPLTTEAISNITTRADKMASTLAQYAMPNPLRWQIFRLQVHR